LLKYHLKLKYSLKSVGKFGSLAFAEGSACAVGAKDNVPCGRHKIELKKRAMEKIKNTEALACRVGKKSPESQC
jgi:hypothetical protein